MAKIDLLTSAKVKALKVPGDYLDGRGLYLQIRNENSNPGCSNFSLHKRAREMGLGSAFDFTLADARERRDELRKLIKQGIYPIEQRRADEAALALARAKTITFKAAGERYIASNLSGRKNIKHADQYRMTLLALDPKGKPAKNDYCKLIRDLPVALIDTDLVMKVLEPIWSTKNETAGRLRGRPRCPGSNGEDQNRRANLLQPDERARTELCGARSVIDRMNEKSRRWIDPKFDREVVPHGFSLDFPGLGRRAWLSRRSGRSRAGALRAR